ncbi:hypothetical protein [Oribacterium sp. P9]|uniref:hypothetical protein n=1 Tax=Oribacterium sp. P9 TaxID=3378068 RepID=UPI003966D693
MDRKELLYEKSLSYDQQIHYLLKKYGAAKFDYFCKPNFKSKNTHKLSRTNEGLICHHIFEKYAIRLSDSISASQAPYEYQKAENLCYCNYLEHYILHKKIAYDYEAYYNEDNQRLVRERTEPRKIDWNTKSAYNMKNMIPMNGGMDLIGREINALYQLNGSTVPWKHMCYLEINNNFEEYTDILAEMIQKAIDSFDGNKEYKSKYRVGAKFHSGAEILEIKKNEFLPEKEELDECYIRFADGHCKWILRKYFDRGNYDKCVKEMIESLSCDWDGKIVQAIADSVTSKVRL